MSRRSVSPELESEIRADERSRVLAEIADQLAGQQPQPLTIDAIKQMTPEQILEHKDEVDRVVAAWDGAAQTTDQD